MKVETKKANNLTNTPTSKISEPNEFVYRATKLVCDKIVNPQGNLKKNTKPGLEIRLEIRIRKLRQQAKVVRKEKYARRYWDENTNTKHQKCQKIPRRDKSKDIGELLYTHNEGRSQHFF